PCRLSGEAFTDLFEVLLQAEPIQWFIDKGWLSDFEYVSAAPDNPLLEKVRGLRKRGADGDYQTKEMVSVMDVPESISHLFETYREFAWGKKGIVYAIDIEHARHIAAFYSSKGVRCAVIDSKTPARERERLVEAYRSTHGVRHLCDIASDITEMPDPSVPPIDVLVNVDIFSEGFDCPEVEFIQLARPTLSLNKYLQQVGRGMRVSKGKPHVLILDNVGLYHTFGLPTDEQDWRLMFLGKQAGKGVAERQEPMLVVDLEAGQRELVNLEMVRVKRRGEIRRGVEVFMQGGKYGVMMDGKMTCPPEFERVTRLADGGNYFALATYPYYLYRNRQTVIDSRGVDLKASLYGNVTREEDFFCAKDIQGNRVFFDGIGRKAYREKPHTTKFRYVDLVEKGGGRYALRRQLPGISPFDFRLDDILYNDHLVIVKDVLMVKGDTEHVYKIVGYQNDYILAGQSIYKNLQLIYYNGKLGRQAMLYQLPEGVRFEPDRQALHVRRVVRL
ncbi:MAG: hypothetical protein IJ569_00425, partial [Prevotella sp.]|nr:hypothetical protein [Prevotella sp.]